MKIINYNSNNNKKNKNNENKVSCEAYNINKHTKRTANIAILKKKCL